MLISDNVTLTTLIQIAVAPVFLIAGVAGLLNLYTSRLVRIIDRLEKLDSYLDNKIKKDPHFKKTDAQKKRREVLISRMYNINWAIFFCSVTGLMIAIVILTVFSSALLGFNADMSVALFFSLAMISLIISLILFLREIFFTTTFIQIKRYEKH